MSVGQVFDGWTEQSVWNIQEEKFFSFQTVKLYDIHFFSKHISNSAQRWNALLKNKWNLLNSKEMLKNEILYFFSRKSCLV